MNLCHLSFLIFYLLSSFWYVEATPNPKTKSVTRGTNVPPAKKETIESTDIEELMRSYSFTYGENAPTDDQPVEETSDQSLDGDGGGFTINDCIWRGGGRESDGGEGRNGLGWFRSGRGRRRGGRGLRVGGRRVGDRGENVGNGGRRNGGNENVQSGNRRNGGNENVQSGNRRNGGNENVGNGTRRNGGDERRGRSRTRPVTGGNTRRNSFDSSNDLADESLILNTGDEIKNAQVQLEPKENENSKKAEESLTQLFGSGVITP